MINSTKIKKIGRLSLPDPEFGDFKLSMFPFEHTGGWVKLPEGFKSWEASLNLILSIIPLCEGANQHYVTIDSKFFTKADFLRREGVHADGNFCVDPNFKAETWGGAAPAPTWGGVTPVKETWGGMEPKKTWGGASPTWGSLRLDKLVAKEDNSHVKMDWVLPYKLMIPIGDYISDKKGGIFAVSTEVGCQGWDGEFYGHVGAEGDYSSMQGQLVEDKKIIFEKDTLYFMTSNTPHETLVVDKGKRRTFMRITLNHEYQNDLLPCLKSELVYVNK